MKEYKQQIIDRIVAQAEGDRMISLYEVGRSLGHKHIKAQDCADIMRAVLKRLPGYEAVRLVAPGQSDQTASLWTTLTFIDKELEYEDYDPAADWEED